MEFLQISSIFSQDFLGFGPMPYWKTTFEKTLKRMPLAMTPTVPNSRSFSVSLSSETAQIIIFFGAKSQKLSQFLSVSTTSLTYLVSFPSKKEFKLFGLSHV